MLVAVVTRFKN